MRLKNGPKEAYFILDILPDRLINGSAVHPDRFLRMNSLCFAVDWSSTRPS